MNEDVAVSTAPQPPPTRRGLGPRASLLLSLAGIAAVVGLAVGVFFAFRGSDSDLEGYFVETGLLLNSINERTGEGSFSSTGPLLAHMSSVFSDTKDSLEAIEAPDEVAITHADLAAALGDEAVLLGELAAEELGIVTTEELSTFLAEHEELNVVVVRVIQNCSELQTVAEENEIEVELGLC